MSATPQSPTRPGDDSVEGAVHAAARALGEARLPAPDVLVLAATGPGALPAGLAERAAVDLADVPGVPGSWRHLALEAGTVEGHGVWLLADAPGEPELGGAPTSAEPAWVRGFPCWLAAASGARVLVHVSAGSALGVPDDDAGDAPPRLEPGVIALVRDHLNLSGRSPLVGLGESRLGPLFPDQSALHDAALRARALAIADERGLPAAEAVVACTLGPAVETPAERAWLARTGANICVQGLANPLVAAAHAALAVLAIVAVVDAGEGRLDLAAILARSERLAPAVDELVARLLPDAGRIARELAEEA